MLTPNFYTIIDTELDEFIQKNSKDKFIQKHRSHVDNQKSYALLIWFLNFYARKANYADFITDGDNDSSCDIVFDKINNQGETVFYVVQSKWNNQKNSEKETNKDEILKALNDFDAILQGTKKNINEKLKDKLSELYSHLKNNGEVKFIFLSLSQYNGGADENIQAFRNNDVKTKFEVIDINRIRVDYIDRKYKKIDPINPLETYENPEESTIQIDIVQKNGNIKIEKPFEAYMLLLRPKAIWQLFKDYGFQLFYKNVRNPLLQSQFNVDIEETALHNPSYFWYYNNGITAITHLLPEIGKNAETVKLIGLQIINGAQTVYSIYRAYESASLIKREQMNTEILVTLRLLKSGGKDFDLNVTRYTNSQNHIQDRDFCANDDIQLRLQNASYRTNVWYEKRRDEFREIPKSVTKVSNFIFANVYLAYHLQDPVSVIKNHNERFRVNKDLNFTSHKDHKDGLYEKIFNDETSFEEMICAFYVFDTLLDSTKISYTATFKSNLYHLLALFKVAFTKYLRVKYGQEINVNKKIIRMYEEGVQARNIIIKTFKFINQFVDKQVEVANNEEKTNEKLIKFLFTLSHYQKINETLEDLEISIDDIESIVLDKDEQIIEGADNQDNIDFTDEGK